MSNNVKPGADFVHRAFWGGWWWCAGTHRQRGCTRANALGSPAFPSPKPFPTAPLAHPSYPRVFHGSACVCGVQEASNLSKVKSFR